jgi:hypothetical protein
MSRITKIVLTVAVFVAIGLMGSLIIWNYSFSIEEGGFFDSNPQFCENYRSGEGGYTASTKEFVGLDLATKQQTKDLVLSTMQVEDEAPAEVKRLLGQLKSEYELVAEGNQAAGLRAVAIAEDVDAYAKEHCS